MEIDFKLTGKSGNRKAVKTTDISEESFRAMKLIVETGCAVNDAITGPSLKDTYNVFGGNCYKALVVMALEQMIAAFVHELEDNDMLSIDGEEAYHKILSIILPLMCYTSDGNEYTETLHFFNPDANEICMVMKDCLTPSVFKVFKEHLKNMMRESDNIAGEAALLAIIYMVSDDNKDSEETVN